MRTHAASPENGFISRELLPIPGGDMFHRHDQASTGSNVFAWCEWDYYLTKYPASHYAFAIMTKEVLKRTALRAGELPSIHAKRKRTTLQ